MTCSGAILKRSWNRKYVGGEMRSPFPNCRCDIRMVSTKSIETKKDVTHVPLKELSIVMESHLRAGKKRAAKATCCYSL